MKLFLLVLLFSISHRLGSSRRCAKKPPIKIYYPEVDAYQILFDVQVAIHTKNLTALPNLLTSELAEFVVGVLNKTQLQEIPVYDIIEVENVDVDNLPNVTFMGTVGKMKVNFTAIYSSSKKRYLLNQEHHLILMINNLELKKLGDNLHKEHALAMLNVVKESIRTKDRALFLNHMLTRDARFLTCDDKSRDGETVFNELEEFPIQFIPMIDHIEVTSVNVSGRDMNFTARIDGRDVEYMARYSKQYLRLFLAQENCSEDFMALVNQTGLAEQFAHRTMKMFLDSLKYLSPQRYNEVVDSYFTEHSCVGNNWRSFKDLTFFSHYLRFKRYYTIDSRNPFNVSDVVFSVRSRSLVFVVEFNEFVRNEVRMVKNNGVYRMVSMKNLRCLDFSWPAKISQEREKYIEDIKNVEQLLSKYVNMRRSSYSKECKDLLASVLTNPYTFENGTEVAHDDIWFCRYSPIFPDLYVISIESDSWGLKKFQAKPEFTNEGYEFEIYTSFFGTRKLKSEQKIWFPW